MFGEGEGWAGVVAAWEGGHGACAARQEGGPPALAPARPTGVLSWLFTHLGALLLPIQLHAYTGVPLLLGFVFMLLVDEIGNSYVRYTDDEETARPSNSKITNTLGLAVHAADTARTFHLFAEGLLGSPRGLNTESLEYAATQLLAAQQRQVLQSLLSGILESSTEAEKSNEIDKALARLITEKEKDY
ncbi:hypothetical protein HJG60_012237 [Phyllostomus discolor]|uniref:Zinc transporter ZIP9 n=1 Tax=Phyllostomus discolor TaxID=89673 RepID=A0A833ZG26_9CHIR|nr:hypothetical protein HJG60_012237 [Phyllostomus discolor]